MKTAIKQFYLSTIYNGDIDRLCNMESYINYDVAKQYNLCSSSTNHIQKHKHDELKQKYLIAINKQNVFAMHNFALYYDIVENNIDEMIKYYLIAIQHLDVRSMRQLALSCQQRNINDNMVEKYNLMAINYYNNLAIQRHLTHREIRQLHSACQNVAVFYYKITSYDKMKKYLSVAIKNNIMYPGKFQKDSMQSAAHLATYYRDVEQNYDEMKKNYLIAIENGDIESMMDLATYYYENKKYDEAIKYYNMGVKNDNDIAAHNLAICHTQIKNYDEAKKYFIVSIDNYEHAESMHGMAMHYKNVEQNYPKMIKYFLMAIEKDHVESMCNLAIYYCNIAHDINNGKKYFMMAAKKGHVNSMVGAAECFRNQINGDESISCEELAKNDKLFDEMEKYYLMAANKGNITSFYELGYHYKTIKNNKEKSDMYYSMFNLASQKDYDKTQKRHLLDDDNELNDSKRTKK
jgi:TPR repeat protein